MTTAEATKPYDRSPEAGTGDPETRKKERLLWLPFGFAAFLSLISIAPIFFGFPDAGHPAFVAFFPMTFFFACTIFLSQSRRIDRLEAELRELRGRDSR